MTTGTKLNDMKEQIKMGLKASKVWVGENENGNVYEVATKQEVTERILAIFDEAAYMVQDGTASGRAFERLIHELCPKVSDEEIFMRYMRLKDEEIGKYNDYIYEEDEFTKEEKRSGFRVIDGEKK